MEDIFNYAKNLTVLYVEDNLDTRTSTLLILNNLFDKVIVACDGEEGLEKFKEDQDIIDIVISDINMPIKNGLEMSEDILKISTGFPILIFSAHSEIEYFLDVIKLGIDGYLLKPLDLEQFLAVLGKVIEKIKLKEENAEYQKSMQLKVKNQVEQLRQKDKLLIQNSKMADMGEMIDIIAHQWKQPLSLISLKSDFVSELAKDDDITKEDILDCSSSIQKQIEHLVNTLNEFRQFFRPTTNIQTIDLSHLVQSLQVLLKDNLIKNNIELLCDFQDIYFEANENEFKHIFINLINNARDAFISNKIKNRQIIIKASNLDNKKVIIQVCDNAGGISQNIIDNIFKQNFTTKEQNGGTGIGLYMCKTIATKYNAQLKVTSDDKGSCFSLTIDKKRNSDEKNINTK